MLLLLCQLSLYTHLSRGAGTIGHGMKGLVLQVMSLSSALRVQFWRGIMLLTAFEVSSIELCTALLVSLFFFTFVVRECTFHLINFVSLYSHLMIRFYCDITVRQISILNCKISYCKLL